MTIQPLDKELYDKMIEEGAIYLKLAFAGGSDEGYLEVECAVSDSLREAIEEWAWEVYEYNGVGGGEGDYGDNITYNLSDKTATHDEWYTQTTYADSGEPESFNVVG